MSLGRLSHGEAGREPERGRRVQSDKLTVLKFLKNRSCKRFEEKHKRERGREGEECQRVQAEHQREGERKKSEMKEAG